MPSIELCVYMRYFAWWHEDTVNTFRISDDIRALERTLHPARYDSDDENSPDGKRGPWPAALSLQCEACGPDLELYQMLRR